MVIYHFDPRIFIALSVIITCKLFLYDLSLLISWMMPRNNCLSNVKLYLLLKIVSALRIYTYWIGSETLPHPEALLVSLYSCLQFCISKITLRLRPLQNHHFTLLLISMVMMFFGAYETVSGSFSQKSFSKIHEGKLQ